MGRSAFKRKKASFPRCKENKKCIPIQGKDKYRLHKLGRKRNQETRKKQKQKVDTIQDILNRQKAAVICCKLERECMVCINRKQSYH